MSGAVVQTRVHWAGLITVAWNKTRDGILDVGRLLDEAKGELEHGQFEAMVEKDLPFGPRSARRFMAIRRDPRISNRTHESVLPANWGTLYELTKLSDEEFAEGVERNIIRPDMERKELNAWRTESKREETAKKIQATAALSGKYSILYADPPWRYENPPMGDTGRSIENHYPTMDLDEICTLPVADIAAEDSLLFLWATAPKLAECQQVIEAWGFNYRTNLVWVKDKIGMGYHVRNAHELLLIAKKGSPPHPPPAARLSSVIEAPRTGHSVKPVEFVERIELMHADMFVSGSKPVAIELFSRDKPRPGWVVWGNQAVAT